MPVVLLPLSPPFIAAAAVARTPVIASVRPPTRLASRIGGRLLPRRCVAPVV